MQTYVLVVTSTAGFGVLIQQTLEDSDRYQVIVTESTAEALRLGGGTPFALSIIDLFEDTEARRELIGSLRQQHPNMLLVIVPPDNNPQSPLFEALRPDGYLTKPFYLPDLLDTLDEVMQAASRPAAQMSTDMAVSETSRKDIPDWLTDVGRAAQYLARLSLESAAQAALIVQEGKLWAYAGELPQPAAQELSQTVSHHWTRGGSSDLARFIRLEATSSEYMLYATRLGGAMVLALVFDVETPFSKIRSQASSLARALASPPSSDPIPLPAEPDDVEDTDQPPVALPPLFDDVPPPSASGWESQPRPVYHPRQAIPEPEEEGLDVEQTKEVPLSFEKPVWEPETGYEPKTPPEGEYSVGADPLGDTRPIPVGSYSAESLSDGPEIVAEELGSLGDLQSVSAAVCNLNYTCMLIPRLPMHHLAGELGARLAEWVAQLCLAFGWRLNHLVVRPDYLLWIVNVSPTVSPSYLVRQMRQHTSQRVFAQFQDLAQENPSGDFWAPGYLIMSSSQPPPVAVMQDFIQGTRRRQGAAKPPMKNQ